MCPPDITISAISKPKASFLAIYGNILKSVGHHNINITAINSCTVLCWQGCTKGVSKKRKDIKLAYELYVANLPERLDEEMAMPIMPTEMQKRLGTQQRALQPKGNLPLGYSSGKVRQYSHNAINDHILHAGE